MIELDSVQNRFFKCRFVQTRKSYANMQFFIISNIQYISKYRIPGMRFEYCNSNFDFELSIFPTIDCVLDQISGNS